MRVLCVAIAVAVLTATNVLASPPPALNGLHQFGLLAGVWNQTTSSRTVIGTGGISTTVGISGAMGGAFYDYWTSEGLAAGVRVTGMMTDIDTEIGLGIVEAQTGSVTMVQVGAKMFLPESTFDTRFRPFVSACVGPVFGHADGVRVGPEIVVESRTETAVGGQVGLGSHFRIGSRLLATALLGYNLMTDFGHEIGGSKNYSGPEFAFGMSVVLGAM